MQPICTRRRLLTIALSMAGASGLVRAPFVLAAEGALETTTVRVFANRPGICVAPQYIAEPLLQAEGFTDVRFVGKLYIIEACIPLRPLDAVSIVIPTVCNEPEQAPDMHPTGKGIGVSTFSAIPPNDGANHGSPLLIPQFWHSGKIATLKHRLHHRYPALENREAKPR